MLFACVASWLLVCTPLGMRACAQAAERSGAPQTGQLVREVVIRGNDRTRANTVLALLPRQPPAHYTDAEVDEFARRLSNIEIFDRVTASRDGERLLVDVREKWTLLPTVDFASGATLRDLYALLGVTEYNFLGTGSVFNVSVSRAQRGYGVSMFFEEHAYRRNRWSFSGDASFAEGEYRFEDDTGWSTRALELGAYMNSPPVLSDFFNTRVGLSYGREDVVRATSEAPPLDSHAAYCIVGFSWDRYNWHDLVPRGVRLTVAAGTGALTAPGVTQPRDFAEARLEAAIPLARLTVLSMRGLVGVLTRGNPNYSYLIGSIEGVRGLADSYYRTWFASYLNAEFRQAVRIAPRWAVQGVAFADAASFAQMNERGARDGFGTALSTGLGMRLIPTWLAATVLRVDGARLFVPEGRWFVQFGLNQYF